MKALQIDIFNDNAEFIFRIICRHAAIHKEYSILYEIQQIGRNMYFLKNVRYYQHTIPVTMNHFVIDSDTGIITVYLENEYYFEVTRLIV